MYSIFSGLPGGLVPQATLGGSSVEPSGNQRGPGPKRPQVGPGDMET